MAHYCSDSVVGSVADNIAVESAALDMVAVEDFEKEDFDMVDAQAEAGCLENCQ